VTIHEHPVTCLGIQWRHADKHLVDRGYRADGRTWVVFQEGVANDGRISECVNCILYSRVLDDLGPCVVSHRFSIALVVVSNYGHFIGLWYFALDEHIIIWSYYKWKNTITRSVTRRSPWRTGSASGSRWRWRVGIGIFRRRISGCCWVFCTSRTSCWPGTITGISVSGTSDRPTWRSSTGGPSPRTASRSRSTRTGVPISRTRYLKLTS